MEKRFAEQVVVITGAASGIGAVIAQHFAREGARLVLSDLDDKGLTTTADGLSSLCREKPLTQGGDLSQEDVAGRLIGDAVKAFGTIDVLVNNAGGGIIKPFLEHTPETLRTTIDRNLWTMLWCTWHAVPVMKAKRYGRIVNIGADSVRNGLYDHAAYNAAKGGVHAIATGLAREFATDEITVNVVAPCIVNTPQVQRAAAKAPQSIRKFIDVVPMGRPGEMDEIASMVCYLASREASFVTGQVISVNGGSTML
ncbi:SDR family oxidoreductase [Bradyrhizobium sp. Leo170]|uniref:SDR family NAD(P)-dependent oxidoreductase n=1 Tax=Bradyrhizobium sp. Leo170 TaxID=1571199 RepID=UPI00102E4164|nr:SDR family oxidoreductase [Bradyrhizobium sp. Leo170]TAI66808.1 2,3-dihydroxy-2,3-dihydro-p-cumate dehydrogenase [Bradyrhizobium sp. Leo170]